MNTLKQSNPPWILNWYVLLVLYTAWLAISIALVASVHWAIGLAIAIVILIALSTTHTTLRAIHKKRLKHLSENDDLSDFNASFKQELNSNYGIDTFWTVSIALVMSCSIFYAIFWIGYNYNPVICAVILLSVALGIVKIFGYKDDDGTYIVIPVNIKKLVATAWYLAGKFARDLLSFTLSFICASLMFIVLVVMAKDVAKTDRGGLYVILSMVATLSLAVPVMAAFMMNIVSKKRWKSKEMTELRQTLSDQSKLYTNNEDITMRNFVRIFMGYTMLRPSMGASLLAGWSVAALIILPKMGGAGNISEAGIVATAGFLVQSIVDFILQDIATILDISFSTLQPADIQARAYAFTLKYVSVAMIVIYIFSVRVEMKMGKATI